MKNPYASPAPPDSELQQKARKLAAWHEQEAMACEHAASLSRDGAEKQRLQQRAVWHRETAQAWRELDKANPQPVQGGFSAQG